mmetsp:Transcript_10001/g.24963  ORF Transcript_10001/g.24963 Transcript_10001/m.24963 type:complete len:213 (-) Transcript_10001:286-924(-)
MVCFQRALDAFLLVLERFNHFAEERLPSRPGGHDGRRHDAGVIRVVGTCSTGTARHVRSIGSPRQKLLGRLTNVLVFLFRFVNNGWCRYSFFFQTGILLVQFFDFFFCQRGGIVLFGNVQIRIVIVVLDGNKSFPICVLGRLDLVGHDICWMVLLFHEKHSQASNFLLGFLELVFHSLDLRNLLQEFRLEIITFFLQAEEIVLELGPALNVS